MEVIWKLHSQPIVKWFARGVSSPLSFFNVTWHQRPHDGKYWMWILPVCWHHLVTHHKITQAHPSDKKLWVVEGGALVDILTTLHELRYGWPMILIDIWGFCVELRASIVKAETWDNAPSQAEVCYISTLTTQSILMCSRPEPPLPSHWSQVAAISARREYQSPTFFLTVFCWASW